MDTAVRLDDGIVYASRARQAGIVPVILSGGSGMRLWPVSRESFPKQFWGLLNHDRSMIVETALRGQGPGFVDRSWCATTFKALN